MNELGTPLLPYEADAPATPLSDVDRLVLGRLGRLGIRAANPCSDGVFIRRVQLDVIGTLPTLDEARRLAASYANFLIVNGAVLMPAYGDPADTAAAIRRLLDAHPLVRHVGPLLPMYIGADQVLLTLDAEFDPRASAAAIAAAIKELEAAIRERFDKITRIYIEAVPAVR